MIFLLELIPKIEMPTMKLRLLTFFQITLLSAISVLFLGNSVLSANPADPQKNRIPEGFDLVYQQEFDSDSSLKQFQFSDWSAWRWTTEGKSGGALELFQQSNYKPENRSPFNLAIVSDLKLGDLVLELDMKQTGKEYGHRDMCLFFGFQNPEQFYYTHLATAPDRNAHNIFLVNGAPRASFVEVPKSGVNWGDSWKHIRLERIGTAIQIYFEEMTLPVLQGQHDAFASGYIGFGSFDDTGCVDNVRVWAKSKESTPKVFFSR